MSTVEYDLDVSGGLMPQVQALIAPPVSDEASKSKKHDKTVHPYFKRPGKGHNHDSCDACAEGGDLICCDKCPASFHLTCHDPPLDETDIPTGQWLCHHCRKTKETSPEKVPQVRNKRSNSSTGSNSSGSNVCPPVKLKKTKQSPMEVLVKAASLLNPKQFELPRQMNTPCVFPGTDKENPSPAGRKPGGGAYNSSSSSSSAKNLKTKPHELNSGGLVPLPARTCYECRRSCRIGPLLSCDYCPLLFHLDCLDPPLTALPAGRWMCPNHVEQYIDSKLVTSVSATERIRLWDKFSGPVDQDAVKMEFFRKVHCKNPPFRVKVRLGTKKRITVPEMVRNHYKNPVPLLPSLRDVLRLETVANRGREYLEYIAAVYVATAAGAAPSNGPAEEDKPKNGQLSIFENDAPVVKSETNDEIIVKTEQNIVNGDCNGVGAPLEGGKFLPDIVAGPVLHADIERSLKQLDERLIQLLAYQRVQHLLAHPHSEFAGAFAQSPRPMPLPSELLTAADIDRITRVFTSPKRTRPRSRSTLRARAMLCPVVSKHFYNVRTSEVDPSQVRHDASFMGYRPTVSARFPEAAAMRYRSLTIGRGSANDIELEKFGHCNYTSPKHAVIFYDECTKHYELINYSEYGTQVNNILYACDFSDKTTTKSPQNNVNLLSNIREIIDKKRRGAKTGRSAPECRMTACADTTSEALECSCGAQPPQGPAAASEADGTGLGAAVERPGWEGPAVLAHGALLRFGCVTFVFSIVECATV